MTAAANTTSRTLRALRRFAPLRYHDRVLRQLNQLHDGAVALGRKAAIYLIFPKDGVLPSHIKALNYMVENGYAPIVVSNLPLSAMDLEKLHAVTFSVLERANFGYDFGGYREAIHVFGTAIRGLDYLAIFNDSVWFPLTGARNWLADAEATGLDFVGSGRHEDLRFDELQAYFDQLATLRDPVPQATAPIPDGWIAFFLAEYPRHRAAGPWVQKGRDFFRRLRHRKNNFHYGSFSLLLGRHIIGGDAFHHFFNGMKISDDKIATIVRGEMGLTQWVMASGFRHGSTLTEADLAAHLANVDDDTLEDYWQNMNFPVWRGFFDLMRAKLPGLSITEFNRAQKLVFMDMIHHQYPFPYVATNYMIRAHGYGFLKKALPKVRQADVRLYTKLLSTRQEPLAEEILAYLTARSL